MQLFFGNVCNCYDTIVYMSGHDLTRLCEDVCEEMNKVDEWLKANRLSLILDKTYSMIHTHDTFDPTDFVINICETPIQYVIKAKLLGLTLDSRSRSNEHVCLLTEKLFRI